MIEKALDQLKTMKEPLAEKHEPTKADERLNAFEEFYKKVCEQKDYNPLNRKNANDRNDQ